MSMSKKDARAIIDRCEDVRNYLHLNKSRFSAEIGMKPQTYSNFIGAQGSRPNVELVRGIAEKYGASLEWLLFGAGPMFRDGASIPEQVAQRVTREDEQDRRIADLENRQALFEQTLQMIGRPVPARKAG